jgi:hypothetical protein
MDAEEASKLTLPFYGWWWRRQTTDLVLTHSVIAQIALFDKIFGWISIDLAISCPFQN